MSAPLKRVWTPSGNYSGGGSKRLIVIHTMEGFTGPNGAKDCAIYFQGDVGASSHVCIDNNRGTVWEGVSRGNGSWTQCQYNSVSVSAEQSGYASWSHDYWLTNRNNQLHNMADWIAEESRALGIPITLLSDSQAQGSGEGVTFHSRLGGAGCGHSDPGSGYPINEVLEWARGGGGVPPETVAPAPKAMNMTSASAYDNNGRLHQAAINQRDEVCYKGPNGNWYAISTNASYKALSGVHIAISGPLDDYPQGEICITYTRFNDDQVCTYRKGVDNPEQWRYAKTGGSYQ
jgi:hypothetical protein